MSRGAINKRRFLSTPSARRATFLAFLIQSNGCISIHALREEGDLRSSHGFRRSPGISIHALREEGDLHRQKHPSRLFVFLSTPSARRATTVSNGRCKKCQISIHALREEGDPAAHLRLRRWRYFYPRPPRGGRPSGADFLFGCQWISIHALREEGDPQHTRTACTS